nr:hypothetical protein CFP56_35299 [Quercus suber]
MGSQIVASEIVEIVTIREWRCEWVLRSLRTASQMSSSDVRIVANGVANGFIGSLNRHEWVRRIFRSS